MTLIELETRFPFIAWRDPVPVMWAGGEHPVFPAGASATTLFACRICIANIGLKRTSAHQWQTKEEADTHIIREHIVEHVQ